MCVFQTKLDGRGLAVQFEWNTHNMLKKNGYHEQIAYELADLFLLHIRLAFERGIFSGIKAHMEHSEPQTNPSNQSNPF